MAAVRLTAEFVDQMLWNFASRRPHPDFGGMDIDTLMPNRRREHRTSNPRVGSSNLSERAKPPFAALRISSHGVAPIPQNPLYSRHNFHCWRPRGVAHRRPHVPAQTSFESTLG